MSKQKIKIIIGLIIGIIFIIVGIAFWPKTTPNQTSQETGTNFFSNIFPFIKNVVTDTTNSLLDTLGINEEIQTEEQKSLLVKVSNFPIAGFGVFNKERFIEVPPMSPAVVSTEPIEATSTITEQIQPEAETKPIAPPTEFIPTIKYVEKATGSIFQTYADKIDERKLSPNTIPVVHEALFGKNGESTIMRYLQENNATIETFIRPLPKEILGGDLIEGFQAPGLFLPENITDLSFSSDKSQIFYLFNTQNSAIGIITDYLGINKTQVFNSPFTEWLSQWPNERMITITTKPSYNVPGYMYAIDPAKKDLNKIIGNINGLTTLTSPNGQLVLYSNNNLALYMYEIGTGNSQPLGIQTLAEKCVWTKASDAIYCAVPKYIPTGNYPDSWYMGEISFNDNVWFIDINSGNTTMVLDVIRAGNEEELDIIKLDTDENQDYLFFMNKKDSYLWELDL
ncbi:MAG: hypothetical protein ABH951_02310 [Patescibacteria group bacterium]